MSNIKSDLTEEQEREYLILTSKLKSLETEDEIEEYLTSDDGFDIIYGMIGLNIGKKFYKFITDNYEIGSPVYQRFLEVLVPEEYEDSSEINDDLVLALGNQENAAIIFNRINFVNLYQLSQKFYQKYKKYMKLGDIMPSLNIENYTEILKDLGQYLRTKNLIVTIDPKTNGIAGHLIRILIRLYPTIFAKGKNRNEIILLNNLDEFHRDTQPVLFDETGQVEENILDMLAQFQ